MSSSATSGLSAGSLARRVRVFTFGLLLCGLLGAAGLAFAGYRAHQVNAAVRNYAPAASLYRARTAAIHQLADMETAFHRFLLDGNSVNLSLVERDKEGIEQLAQQDPEAQGDKLLQDIVAKEQQWYSQAAQPLIEQRKTVPAGQGAMAAIMGLSPAVVQDSCKRAAEGEICAPANLNSPEQTVISGHAGAVKRAVEIASQLGAKRSMVLPVSAPFHSELMMPAQEELEKDLNATTFADLRVPLVTNVDADSIRQGVRASIASLVVVMIFLVVYYRQSGVNAVVALILNLIILIAFMAYAGAVLTLPGIAGVILTIGMGVDSNVLVF